MDNETQDTPLKEVSNDDVPTNQLKDPKATEIPKEKTYMEYVNEIESEEEDEAVYDAMVDADW